MTMRIRISNEEDRDGRVANVRVTERDARDGGTRMTQFARLAGGETSDFYIHAGSIIEVVEDPHATIPVIAEALASRVSPSPAAGSKWPMCVDCPALKRSPERECDDLQCFNAQHRRAGKVVGTDGSPAAEQRTT